VNFAIVDAECGLAFLAARSTSCHAGSTARTRAQPGATARTANYGQTRVVLFECGIRLNNRT